MFQGKELPASSRYERGKSRFLLNDDNLQKDSVAAQEITN
jgi:hypothetical protein